MRAFDSATKGREYVASKLSSVSATVGKETSHRNGALLVRQIRLEGLASAIERFHQRILVIEIYSALTMTNREVNGSFVAGTLQIQK